MPPEPHVQVPRMPLSRFLLQAPALLADRPAALLAIARTYGDLVRVPVPGKPFILVSDPRMARRVLQVNAKNYRKSFDFRIVRTLLGAGPITVHDDAWRVTRQTSQPALKRDMIANMVDPLTRVIATKREGWLAAADEPFAAQASMTDLTLEILTIALFQIEAAADSHAISAAVDDALRHLDRRLEALVDLDDWLPSASKRRFKRAKLYLDSVMDAWVEERSQRPLEGTDLLGILILKSRELPDGRRWLLDQLLTYLIAGHETSAVTMAWCLHLLSLHPEVHAQLHAEVDEVLGGRVPTQAEVPGLRYHRMVLRETLRLYPPAWALGREAIEADTFGEYDVPAGSTVVVSPYIVQRHPTWWPEPDRFDPERFRDAPELGKSEFTWLPFSAGPRFCPGAHLAMLELSLMLAMFNQAFAVAPVEGHVVGREALITLRPLPDVLLRLTRRSSS